MVGNDFRFLITGSARLDLFRRSGDSLVGRYNLFHTDRGYGLYRLYYARTLDKKEIDFVVTKDRKPILCLEVKTGNTHLSGTLKDRRKWFPDQSTLGVQLVDKR